MPADPVRDAARSGDRAAGTRHLRDPQRDPGAVRGGRSVCGADHARDVRPDFTATGAGGTDAGMQSQSGVLAGVVTASAARHCDGGDSGLGTSAGRVRAGAGLRRGDASVHGGPADDRVSGAEHRQPGGGRGGIGADGGRRPRCAANRAGVWYGRGRGQRSLRAAEVSTMASLAEFLKREGREHLNEIASADEMRKEWLDSLGRLMEQLRRWLVEADPEGALEVVPREYEIIEARLGCYHAPGLVLRLGARQAEVTPGLRTGSR